MSAVPGSEKVTRCTSKPAAFSRSSRTPSAPASAGVTDGQRTRSRAMETASIMSPLNTPERRWASFVRHQFDLALLVPARPCVARGPWRQRVRAKAVGPARALQAIHFDEAPQAENERGDGQRQVGVGVGEPVRELVVEAGQDEEQHHPPPALV